MVVIKNLLLSTQITALKVKGDNVFIGEGQYLHIHTLKSGTRLLTHEVFEAAVVHGIELRLNGSDGSSDWILSVWGQKSLAILQYKSLENKINVLLKETRFEDWIIDAALEEDLSHAILATAHNSLIRYKLQHIIGNLSNSLINEEKQETIGSSSKKSDILETNTDNREESQCQPLTWSNTRWKQDGCQVVKVDCVENCILYCGHIVLLGGDWQSAVLMAGTVFSQVLIWGPWCPKDGKGRVLPLHRLSGHEGVLFSINFSATQNLITTTSDDRSLRIWDITTKSSQNPQSDVIVPSLHNAITQDKNIAKVQQYWTNIEIVEKHICYGHGARVWQSLPLTSCIVTVGEDSKVCVWDLQGQLVTSWKGHDGSCIWRVAASHDEAHLVTGGGDGSVKTWSLTLNDSQKAEPLVGGPLVHKETLNEYVYLEENMIRNQNNQNQISKVADFPRSVILAGINNFIIATDRGYLCQWNSEKESWSIVREDPRMKSYVVMDTSIDQNKLAVGLLCGVVLIFRKTNCGEWQMLTEAKLCQGKVFSLLWLGVNHLLACGPDGAISTWRYSEGEGLLKSKSTHILPSCKQRWVSAACVTPANDASAYALICGDRAGSLHLYHQETSEPQQTLRSIHGRNGVTSLIAHEGLVYSSGRDGYVRCLKVSHEGMQALMVTRVSNVNWVAQVMFLQGRPMAICFHDVYMKLWSLEEDRAVVEVECGGGHRSWALQTSKDSDELVFFFLKDGVSYIYRTTLTDKLMPLIKVPVNTRETMCLEPLFHVKGETFFVTGGEDTTIRIHSIQGFESHRAECVMRSHISNIRALCCIEGEEVNGIDGGERTVWFVSAGGRAQMKVWKVMHNDVSQLCINKTNNQEPSIEVECPEHQPKKPQASRLSCREVTSHMIRTGSNKTWKSQELTFDPETRYMDATAFWVTDHLALIVLASSDGVLRIFRFNGHTEKLSLVCSQVCDHCLLKVTRMPLREEYILVSAATSGEIAFWDLKSVVTWLSSSDITGDNTPPVLQICHMMSIQSHQSGVNSLSICCNPSPENVDQIISQSHFTLAAGGDDNKLAVWDVTVDASCTKVEASFICDAIGHASQITGLEWLSQEQFISTSIDQRVVLWELSRNESCYSFQNNIEEDKNSTLREIANDSKKTPLANLKAISSAYSGVPDVKGLAIIPLYNCNQNTKEGFAQRIFVYGNGLQVYDLDTR